ncbi:MAG: Spy/CpxP family protein refolding chaperone [Campylobacterota bacterium]|nr:Spy/CpxP family protein refolding chaperone [Campylobacterota bacterium]
MKKTTIAVMITLGLGTAALLACGGPEHKGGPFGDRGGMFKVMKQLDLTSEQKEQMKLFRAERKSHMKATFREMKENKKSMMASMKPDLSTFMTADSFDKVAFKAQVEKKFEAKRKMMETKKSEMLEKRASGMEKVFNILTPEQRVKWIELSKEK